MSDRTVRSIAAAVTIATFPGAASTASAHELVNGQATCTGRTAGYAGFDDNEKPATYSVTVDTVAQTSTYGRRQVRDSRGRRFTMCRTKPVPIAVRIPHFTG
jgi:hypothetical protein